MPYVAAYKPNMAFYEARGAAGWQELAATLSPAASPSTRRIFTIADAKRADIGSTNAGYVAGLLDELGFDAITLHPYLGAQALDPSWSATTRPASCSAAPATPGPGSSRTCDVGGAPALGSRGRACP